MHNNPCLAQLAAAVRSAPTPTLAGDRAYRDVLQLMPHVLHTRARCRGTHWSAHAQVQRAHAPGGCSTGSSMLLPLPCAAARVLLVSACAQVRCRSVRVYLSVSTSTCMRHATQHSITTALPCPMGMAARFLGGRMTVLVCALQGHCGCMQHGCMQHGCMHQQQHTHTHKHSTRRCSGHSCRCEMLGRSPRCLHTHIHTWRP